jgi:bifunctional DNA-binding transcriptional regulator/antitoxin component of YhaV-PrlF toxin-antitoxin module
MTAHLTTYLTVSSKGQVTLKKPILAHLGVQPGQKVALELRPGGGVELRPAPTGKISDAFGILPTPEGPALTIEEMNDVIARGWAGAL